MGAVHVRVRVVGGGRCVRLQEEHGKQSQPQSTHPHISAAAPPPFQHTHTWFDREPEGVAEGEWVVGGHLLVPLGKGVEVGNQLHCEKRDGLGWAPSEVLRKTRGESAKGRKA